MAINLRNIYATFVVVLVCVCVRARARRLEKNKGGGFLKSILTVQSDGDN
jgi:hypothetical protein